MRERKPMKYIARTIGRSVELSEANSSVLVYRIPYQNLLDGADDSIRIKNKFIVYILLGERADGKDAMYVGKSKNGLKNRPTSHGNNWTYCYILTQIEERTFFNDGTIQYIEDQINRRIKDTNHYLNTTQVTNSETVNRLDEEDCDIYLEKAYQMLDVLGLDLITFYSDQEEEGEIPSFETDGQEGAGVIPDGVYSMSWKLKRWDGRTAKGKMQVTGGKCIVLAGSMVCPNEGHGLIDVVRIKRQNASVENGILQEDVVFKSPSGAAEFITGGAANGWTTWRTEDGSYIDIFRKG